MAKLFDPLGILGPIIIKAKIFMQMLWKEKLSWDEPLLDHPKEEWQNYRADLTALKSFSVPRLVKAPGSANNIQLHGFCDASERAYGACIYIRSVGHDGVVTVRLLTAKSRVAPVHHTTIPRLELCSAVLPSHLYCKVTESLNVGADAFFWSDSMITLHWLHNSPSKYKTFVANRIAEVQRITDGCTWNHVAGLENPADIISRGTSSSDLFNLALWWKGSPWLTSDPTEWPNSFVKFDTTKFPTKVLEEKTCPFIYSSLTRLLRIVAYCRRFIQHCRSKLSGTIPVSSPYLTADELSRAAFGLVVTTQAECFPQQLALVRDGKESELKKSWRKLDPFLHEGALRVGGRLNQSLYSFTRKHPLILPAVHPFTELILDSAHKQLMHAGPRLMIAHIRERFWPLNLRNLARKKVRSCIQCYRVQPRPESQLMGQLPKVRITPARAFLNTGVDFCGPVLIKHAVRRSKPIPPSRAYIALFVCMVTKAVHLELVSDLSTEGFIAALKRFVVRRGRPISVYCDNATNFSGAERELQALLKQFLNQQQREKIISFCADVTVGFHFIPARAPTFGGLWEAAVKALKHHLRRVVGTESLTSEAMQTVLCQIESCLNSRPLTAASEDPSDLGVLTPGHFLVGSALQSIPEPDLASVPCNRLSLWQAIQRKCQQFWKLWSTDYLHQLQQRTKNLYRQPNILVGKLVLLKDDNLPPLKWSLARVTAVRPGPDELVRVVSVKFPSGAIYDRPILKVCLLPINDTTADSATDSEETGGDPEDEQIQPSNTTEDNES
ncbi:uncharacterized protein LOC131680443 [Topomyia yanbarensis]|uniref:uncharacterized protein LOC131680443 n=1 Tax=Topomyia yanbarensis TaxID=2498891 RepID=UPI00273C24E8|nr:uncharacterized protein LOC131680443 [Topomyia yanbarensis]